MEEKIVLQKHEIKMKINNKIKKNKSLKKIKKQNTVNLKIKDVKWFSGNNVEKSFKICYDKL